MALEVKIRNFAFHSLKKAVCNLKCYSVFYYFTKLSLQTERTCIIAKINNLSINNS